MIKFSFLHFVALGFTTINVLDISVFGETDFHCESVGLKADPYNCQRFFWCTFDDHVLKAIELVCGTGLIFDVKLRKCMSPWLSSRERCGEEDMSNEIYGDTNFTLQIKRRTGATNACTQEGFFGDEEDCKKFYRCVNDDKGMFIKYEFSCGDGSVWDQDTLSCNHAWAVKNKKCKHGGTDKLDQNGASSSTDLPNQGIATTPSPEIKCKEEGFLPDEKDCQAFYWCTKEENAFVIHKLKCGQNMVYDIERSLCVKLEETTRTDCTTDPNRPDYQIQNAITPEPIYSSSTSDNYQNSSTKSPDDPNNNSPSIECGQEGFLADPTDCKRFYRCVDNGRGGFTKYEFTCAQGTIWDSELNNCNYPSPGPKCDNLNSQSTTDIWNQGAYVTQGNLKETTTIRTTEQTTIKESWQFTAISSISSSTDNTTTKVTITNTNQSPVTEASESTYASSKTNSKQSTTISTTEKSTTNQNGLSPTSSESIESSIIATTSTKPTSITDVSESSYEPSKSPNTETTIKSTTSSEPEETTASNNVNSATTQENDCNQEGFMPDHNECNKFYRCVADGKGSYIKYQFSCAEGTVWDTELNNCNYPWAAKNEKCRNTTPSNTSNTNEVSATTINQISTNTKITTPSTTLLTTDTANQITTAETSTSSSQETKEPDVASTTESGNNIEWPLECEAEEYLSDPKDCKKFYRCVNDGKGGHIKYEFTCRQGTIWDAKIQTCNYPSAVTNNKCSSTRPTGITGENSNATTRKPVISTSTLISSTKTTESSSEHSGTQTVPSQSETSTQSSAAQATSTGTTTKPAISSSTLISSSVSTESSSVHSTSQTLTNQSETATEAATATTAATTTAQTGASADVSSTEITQSQSTTTTQTISSSSSVTPTQAPVGTSSSQATIISSATVTNAGTNTTDIPNKCVKEGFFADSQNCKKFYRCVDNGKGGFTRYEFICAEGTLWDSEQSTCNYPWAVQNKCGSGVSITASSTNPATISSQYTDSPTKTTEVQLTTNIGISESTATETQTESTITNVQTSDSTTTQITEQPNKPTTTHTTSEQITHIETQKSTESTSTSSPDISTETSPVTNEVTRTTSESATTSNVETTEAITELNLTSENPLITTEAVSSILTEQTTNQATESSSTTEQIHQTTTEKSEPTQATTQSSTQTQASTTKQTTTSGQSTSSSEISTQSSATAQTSTATKKPIPGDQANQCIQEGFFSNTENCQKFYRCVSNGQNSFIKYEFTCGPGTLWDPDLETCNHEWAVKNNCKKANGSTPGGETDHSKKVCKDEGFFGHTSDCKKFYRCVENGRGSYIKYNFTCGEGTVWDQDLETCNYPWATANPSCDQNESDKKTTTEEPTSTPDQITANINETLTSETETSSVTTEQLTTEPRTETTTDITTELTTESAKSTTEQSTIVPTTTDLITESITHTQQIESTTDSITTAQQTESTTESITPTQQTESTTTEGTTTEIQTSSTTLQTTTETETHSTLTTETTDSTAAQTESTTDSETTHTETPTSTSVTESTESLTEIQTSTTEQSTTEASATITETATTELQTESSTTEQQTESSTTEAQTESTSTTLSSPTTTDTASTESTTAEITTEITTSTELSTTTAQSTENPTTTLTTSSPVVTTTSTTATNQTSCPIGQLEGDQVSLVCPTGFRRHPKYCNLFYQCTMDSNTYEIKVLVLTCPDGSIYDDSKIQCLPPEETNQQCRAQIAQHSLLKKAGNAMATLQIPTRKNLCPNTGSFSIDNSDFCNSAFIKCVQGDSSERSVRGFVYQCPQEYTYWSISRRCERYSDILGCGSTPSYESKWAIPEETINSFSV